ncbi:unnamed protein product [Dracunculus medinensis]|uniref:EB domain-containing protein n=1 Tax=Dracunculus medinensis TaxID=318479 RepID=A0A0N4UCF8_DRAME|nr:unnamed protein product [Dracunculus medinensis]
MAFYTIEKDTSLMPIKCWQRCSCLDKKYLEISGRCVEISFVDANGPSQKKTYLLNKVVNDFECRMVGRSCGENMVFEIISKLNGSCVDKCVCAYNFVQNNIGCDRCDWDEDDANDNDLNNLYASLPVPITVRLGQRIYDKRCIISGQTCGINMVFEAINNVKNAYCIQKCVCDHYSKEKNGECIAKRNSECAKNLRKALKMRKEKEIRCIRTRTCKLNEIFYEIQCILQEYSCGPNMQLVVIDKRPSNNVNRWKCVMQCQCVYGYIETSNRCSEIIKGVKERMNCMRGRCMLNEVVQDNGCSLKDQFCGRNMKFTLIKQSMKNNHISCIVQCKCAEGFEEENGQCRKHKNSCLENGCKAGMTIHDEGCHLTGEKCGNNMVFTMVNSGVYIGKEYNVGEEISDLGCRLRNFQCGTNKKFIVVGEYSAKHNPNIKGCIERCSCIMAGPGDCMHNF